MPDLGLDTTQDQRLREAIKTIIAAQVTTAVVHPVWVMGLADYENANILKSSLDSDRIHAYTITRIKQEVHASTDFTANPFGQNALAFPLLTAATFLIRAVHYFAYGGATGTNTENLFTEELTKLVVAFARRNHLDLDQTIQTHDQLQITKQGFQSFGETLCHTADLQLTVRFIQQITP